MHAASICLRVLLHPLVALLTLFGVFSVQAQATGWQQLVLAGKGELRLQHRHKLSAADATGAKETAAALIRWTREHRWSPLRVIVDDSHTLVKELKAGPVLMLVPEDSSLPVIWLSLKADAGKRHALLENRSNGTITVNDLPAGSSLDLRWLGM